MTWTAHYFDPQLNRDAATRGFGSKDDALTAACDLIRRRCLVHFVKAQTKRSALLRSRLAAFVQGLQQLGWTDGRNVRIDTRWAAGNAADLRKYAAELATA